MDDAVSRPGIPSPAATPLALARLTLVNFRSYAHSALSLEAKPVVLAGANGTGKTNCLEAVSLLSPGRGLRAAKLPLLQRKAPLEAPRGMAEDITDPFAANPFAGSLWAVSATLMRPDGVWELGTGGVQSQNGVRRAVHLNGAPAKAPELAALIPMLWLTPAMDRLFLEGPGERRRFLDRLVFALDPAHAKRASRYEHAMQERLRLLRDGVRDAAWLDGLEAAMAEEGTGVTAARLNAIALLNDELSGLKAEGRFPAAHLSLNDSWKDCDPGRLQQALSASRGFDAAAGRSLVGPHLTDLDVRHTAKRADARDCSTGEQKALLISIVLADARLNAKRHDGIAPILLMDEIVAHLDAERRAALFEEILALKAQAWLTGTDRALFEPLLGEAQCFSVSGGRFTAED